MRAHLIQHVALRTDDEHVPMTPWRAALLPTFAGTRADLELCRVPPHHFAVQQPPSQAP